MGKVIWVSESPVGLVVGGKWELIGSFKANRKHIYGTIVAENI